MKTNLSRSFAWFCTILLLGAAPTVHADDVTESIDEALEAYNEGDYVMATQALEAAVQLIKQRKGESLAGLLPQPPEGWEAEDAESEAMASSFFGGGVSAERIYTKGDAEITVKYLSDSPMMQGIMMMIGNPMFANADGGKLVRMNGQRAILKYDDSDESGSLQFAINGALLVQVEGDGCTADDLKLFGEAIPVDEITGVL